MKQKKTIGVSIICFAFNHERFIRKAIEGFLMQKTNFEYEIIIHDDVSTDGTREILQEYQRKYPDNIHLVLEKENQCSKGKSLLKPCYPEIKGKYIAMTDGDDEWTYNGKLQEQYDLMEKNKNISFCYHNVIRYNLQTGERVPQITNKESGILSDEEIILEPQGRAPTTAFFFRTEYISGIPEFSYHATVEDDPVRLYYACKGDIFYINKIWAVRNFMHEESWNYQIYQIKDVSFRIDYIKKYLIYLAKFNSYSQKRFDKFLQDKINYLCSWAIETLQPEILDKKELGKIIDSFGKETEERFNEILNQIYNCMLPCCFDYLDGEIEKFIDKCKVDKGELYLYGAGGVAKYFAEKLEYRNISFKGFVVSDDHERRYTFMGRKVWKIAEIDKEKSYIWLTLNEKNTQEVLSTIKDAGYSNILYKEFGKQSSWRVKKQP